MLHVKFKDHIPLEFVFALATQSERNLHKQHEMYMANVNLTLAYQFFLNLSIFHQFASVMLRVGSARTFKYQHVGIDNVKVALGVLFNSKLLISHFISHIK